MQFQLTKLLLVLALILLTACGDEEEPKTNTAPEPVAETPTSMVAPEQPATAAQPVAPVAPIALPTPDPAKVEGVIQVEGSEVVYDISLEMARLFARHGYHANVKMKPTDTGLGFAAFCQADSPIDIVNANRQITAAEIEACRAVGREPLEFQIAQGIIVIVIHRDNAFLQDVTLEQLARIFSNEATNWSDIDPSWPQEPILRYSPDEGSGVFNYFVQTVMNPVYAPEGTADPEKGKATLLAAANLQLLERSSQLLEAVSQNPNAIGVVGGIDYYTTDARLKLLALNGFPALPKHYHEGEYPLLRPLYIYSDAQIMRAKPQVAAFINFYLTEINQEITNVGLSPLPESILNIGRQRWLDAMQQ